MLARSVAAAALLSLAATASVGFAADADHGKAMFQRCANCHALGAGDDGTGPSLHGLFGRKAGSEPGFNYSKAMRASGIVWDAASLTKFLADPEDAIPGTRMRAGAVEDPAALRDLIAYLRDATK